MEQEDLDQRKQELDKSERWRSIPKVTGQLLYQLVMVTNPRKIVEIGMSHGYSTIWMGRAAKIIGAEIFSYEIEQWRYEQAVSNFKEAGMEDVIRPHLVDPNFSDYPEGIDLVFIDAEKSDYVAHFNHVIQKLNANGVILADNTISHQDELASYIETVRGHPEVFSIPLPVGKGVEFSRRVHQNE